MSILHFVTLVSIGIFVGFLANTFTLQRVPGGLYGFAIVGIIGAIGLDRLLYFFVESKSVFFWLCSRPAIVIEAVIGAAIAVGLFNSIKWEL